MSIGYRGGRPAVRGFAERRGFSLSRQGVHDAFAADSQAVADLSADTSLTDSRSLHRRHIRLEQANERS